LSFVFVVVVVMLDCRLAVGGGYILDVDDSPHQKLDLLGK
jgi:hypothetical protein